MIDKFAYSLECCSIKSKKKFRILFQNTQYNQTMTKLKSISICLFLILLAIEKLDQVISQTLYSSPQSHLKGHVRLVRLCIASVDPIKLSSQCVMCTRRGFPINVIECTGLTKENDLISTPLSVVQATCLIYNCRKEVPNISPEPYHGSATLASQAQASSAQMSSVARLQNPFVPYHQSLGQSSLASYNPIVRGLVVQPPPIASAIAPTLSSQFMSRNPISSASMYSHYNSNLGPYEQHANLDGRDYMASSSRGSQMPLPYAYVPASYTSLLGELK